MNMLTSCLAKDCPCPKFIVRRDGTDDSSCYCTHPKEWHKEDRSPMNPPVSELRSITNGIFKSSTVRGPLNFYNREPSSSTSRSPRSPSHSSLPNFPPEAVFGAKKAKGPVGTSATNSSTLTADEAASAVSILIIFSDIEAREVVQVREAFYAIDPRFVETELVDVVLTPKGGDTTSLSLEVGKTAVRSVATEEDGSDDDDWKGVKKMMTGKALKRSKPKEMEAIVVFSGGSTPLDRAIGTEGFIDSLMSSVLGYERPSYFLVSPYGDANPSDTLVGVRTVKGNKSLNCSKTHDSSFTVHCTRSYFQVTQPPIKDSNLGGRPKKLDKEKGQKFTRVLAFCVPNKYNKSSHDAVVQDICIACKNCFEDRGTEVGRTFSETEVGYRCTCGAFLCNGEDKCGDNYYRKHTICSICRADVPLTWGVVKGGRQGGRTMYEEDEDNGDDFGDNETNGTATKTFLDPIAEDGDVVFQGTTSTTNAGYALRSRDGYSSETSQDSKNKKQKK